LKNKKIILVVSIIIIIAILIAVSIFMMNKNNGNQNVGNLKERDEKEYIVSTPNNNNISGQFTDKKINDSNSAITSIKDINNQLDIDLSKYKFIEEKSDTSGDYFNTFKLKQTYNGVEIYGADLIVYTDKNGNAKGIINGCVNMNDNIETSPKTSINDIIDGVINQKLHELEINPNNVTINSDLVIYPYNDKFILVHIVYINTDLGMITFFVNDENQEIIDENYNIYGIASLDEVSKFKNAETGKYRLLDEQRNIIVTHMDNPFWHNKAHSYYEWSTIQEANDLDIDTAITTLNLGIKIYDYYYNRLNRKSIRGNNEYPIALITNCIWTLDDKLTDRGLMLNNAMYSYQDEFDAILFSIDNKFNDDIATVAHEYTHGVFRSIIGEEVSDKLETSSVNEAYADIIGMCTEAYYNSSEELSGEMKKVKRNIKDSTLKLSDFGKKSLYDEHDYSVILSKVAYTMNDYFTVKEIEQLWYNSMKLLRSDCTFYNSMYAVIETSKMMGFTEEQQEKIKSAFYEQGFEEIIITNPLEHTAENKNELLTEIGAEEKKKNIIGTWKAISTDNDNYSLGYIYGTGLKEANELKLNQDGTYVLALGLTYYQKGNYEIDTDEIILTNNVNESDNPDTEIIEKFTIKNDKILLQETIDGINVNEIFEKEK